MQNKSGEQQNKPFSKSRQHFGTLFRKIIQKPQVSSFVHLYSRLIDHDKEAHENKVLVKLEAIVLAVMFVCHVNLWKVHKYIKCYNIFKASNIANLLAAGENYVCARRGGSDQGFRLFAQHT